MDEADLLAASAASAQDSNPATPIDAARRSEAECKWDDAAARWREVRRALPQDPAGYLGEAAALRRLGCTEDADAVLAEAVERLPAERDPCSEWCLLAQHQQDWAKAVVRWDLFRARFPDDPVGYQLGATALVRLGCFDDAEDLLAAGHERFPGDLGLAHESAWAATHKGNKEEALQRWELLRTRFAGWLGGYTGTAMMLRQLARFEEAEAVLAETIERFPAERVPLFEYARMAELRGAWADAAARWEAVRDRYPEDIAAHAAAAVAHAEAGDRDSSDKLLREAAERLRASQATLPSALGQGFFFERIFELRNADGRLICNDLRLNPDGTIGGDATDQISAWEWQPFGLLFRSRSGRPATLFDQVEFPEGAAVFLGRIPDLHPDRHLHRLIEKPFRPLRLASIAKAGPTTEGTGKEFAVLIRSHKADEKFEDLLRKAEIGRSLYDLYPIVDETRGRPERPIARAIWHSVDACRELGLTQPLVQNFLHWCGDVPFYFALREIPDYKYYIMIEDDVDLVDPGQHFIDCVCAEWARYTRRGTEASDVDYIGLDLKKEAPGWISYDSCRKLLPEHFCYFSYFPFVGLSRRAVAYLFSQRLLEAARATGVPDLIYCEAFVPSFLMAGGFRCIDLNELMPGSYDQNMRWQLGHDATGKPMGSQFSVSPGIQIVHPVYSHQEYLERCFRKFGEHRQDWEMLRRMLASEDAAVVPGDLKRQILSRIPAHAAAPVE